MAKLGKLLALTQSDNDHEVAGCMRAANRMLATEQTSWEEVLKGPERVLRVSIQREPYQTDENWVAPHLKDKVMIELMFRSIYSAPRTGNEDFWRWVDDVHAKWLRFGQLTQGQHTALRNCYKRTLRS